MKIQGRFIAVLAVLGLLIALLPLAPAGAVTGVVKLSGGEKGQFFSNQSGNNILTIEVTDADLTPVRFGTARSNTPADDGGGNTVNLNEYVVAGEKDKIDMFNGGTTNGPCREADLIAHDTDGDGTVGVGEFLQGDLEASVDDGNGNPEAAAAVRDPDLANLLHERCPDDGDGDSMTVVLAADGTIDTAASATAPNAGPAPTPLTPEQLGMLAHQFELTEVARDRQVATPTSTEVGLNEIKDIVSVVVNGRTATAAPDNAVATTPPAAGTGPWYSVTIAEPGTDDNETPGGGITHVIVRGVPPQAVDNSVSVSYRMSEFDFAPAPADGVDLPSSTPLNLAHSSVRYGGTNYTNANNQVSLSTVSDTTINVTGTTPLANHVIATFAYDVQDSKKDLVTLNSSNAGDRKLEIKETTASSNAFEAKVAVFSVDDATAINDAVLAPANDTDADGTVTVAELTAALGDLSNNRSLGARVQVAAGADGLGLATTDPAADFTTKMIQARHGDVINVVYADTNPSIRVSKTAAVDLEAPVVTLIGPADKFFTNTSTVVFSVDVVDTGSGVPDISDGDAPEIKVQAGTSGVSLSGSLIRTPIVDGYRLTVNPEGAISEGKKLWFVAVRDKVGNEPVMNDPDTEDINEAPRGAAGLNVQPAGNPFEFTVDTRAPQLATGETGWSLKNPGVTSGANQETETKSNRTWVRVMFNTHDGTAPLDASTVEANDFRVDGLAPLDAKINARPQGCNEDRSVCEIAKGEAVYLQVAQMNTDDRPEVQMTGEIKDVAGNIRTEGRLTAIADGLNPILEVTPSTNLAEKEITVTISSSETLRSNPILEITETKPVKGEDLVAATTQGVSLVTGSLTRWTTTIKNTTDAASRKYVVVTGIDLAGNGEGTKVGDATDDDDIVTFQLDDAAPSLKFVDASGKDLEDSKQTEGAVWLVAQFDEDEHADAEGETTDKSRGVTITELVLTDTDTDAVKTDDASAIFGSEENCVDHDTSPDNARYNAADPQMNNKCAERTLAVDLTPGSYNIKVTGVDALGNDVTGNTDFTVIEAAPFELDLRPGVNFISIPGMPMADGGEINVLLGSHPITTVSTYDRSMELQGQNPWLRATKDAETGMFSGDITMIEPGKAYFITATASSTVEVKLQQAVVELPPTISVRQGFNAIGFWSPSGAPDAEIDDYLNSIGWTVAYSYDPTPGRGWETIRRGETNEDGDGLLIEEGKGYLVYATYDAVLTP